MEPLRYSAAACQLDVPNPTRRDEIAGRVTRMIGMVRMAVEGYSPFLPVKLLVFPEFAHAAPVYPTAKELRRHLTVPIPNEHTDEKNLTVEKTRSTIAAAKARWKESNES